jgi:hypothetical protein
MPTAVELILFFQLFFLRTYTLVKQDKKGELPVGILARVFRTVKKAPTYFAGLTVHKESA